MAVPARLPAADAGDGAAAAAAPASEAAAAAVAAPGGAAEVPAHPELVEAARLGLQELAAAMTQLQAQRQVVKERFMRCVMALSKLAAGDKVSLGDWEATVPDSGGPTPTWLAELKFRSTADPTAEAQTLLQVVGSKGRRARAAFTISSYLSEGGQLVVAAFEKDDPEMAAAVRAGDVVEQRRLLVAMRDGKAAEAQPWMVGSKAAQGAKRVEGRFPAGTLFWPARPFTLAIEHLDADAAKKRAREEAEAGGADEEGEAGRAAKATRRDGAGCRGAAAKAVRKEAGGGGSRRARQGGARVGSGSRRRENPMEEHMFAHAEITFPVALPPGDGGVVEYEDRAATDRVVANLRQLQPSPAAGLSEVLRVEGAAVMMYELPAAVLKETAVDAVVAHAIKHGVEVANGVRLEGGRAVAVAGVPQGPRRLELALRAGRRGRATCVPGRM